MKLKILKSTIAAIAATFFLNTFLLPALGQSIPTNPSGTGGTLKMLSGTGSFTSISAASKTLNVSPGATLNGTVNLQTFAEGCNVCAVPLIWTPSWGDDSTSWQLINYIPNNGYSSQTANVSVTAPTTPGIYHIFFAFEWEIGGDHVASGSNWGLGYDVWNDGNDIAEFSAAQISSAQLNGYAQDEWLFGGGGTPPYYSEQWTPSDAITLIVGTPPPSVILTISACQGGSVTYSNANAGSGTVSGGQSVPIQVPVGSSLTLGAHSAAFSSSVSWSFSSGISGVPENTTANPITITVNGNAQITASFSAWSTQLPNYSGYYVGSSVGPSAYVVNDVKGTWIVPTVQPGIYSLSSTWIGISGSNGAALVQIGTHQDTLLGGSSYYAWYEVIDSQHPNSAQQTIYSVPVSAGDTIAAEVTNIGPSTYQLAIVNTTQGRSTNVIAYSGFNDREYADWIVEDPGFKDLGGLVSGLYVLANFGTVNFSGCYANVNSVEVPIMSFETNWPEVITMTNDNWIGGKSATSSPLSCDGTSFTVTYGSQSTTGTLLAINITDSPSDGGTDSGSVNVYSNSPVTVTATPNSCFSFENWTENGVYLTNSPTYTFAATTNRNLMANFVTNIYTITTSSSPFDGGTVTGAATVDCGDSVTLVASNNPNYSFTGWTWINDGVTNWITDLSPFTFTISANSNLVANFVPLGSSTITTVVSPPSAGSTTGGGKYTNEVTATIAATAAHCYAFLYWTTNGVPFSFSPTNIISVTTNEVFTANFAPISYKIAVNASAGGMVGGGGSHNCGDAVTLLATPNPCYSFVNWTENGSPVSSLSAFYFVVDTNHNFVANFAPATSTISTTSSPANGGTASGGGTFGCDFSVAMTAAANSGYAFANWTENGVIINTSSNFTFTASGNQSLVANFVPNVRLGLGSPLWSAGNLNLILQGPIGSNYVIYSSSDLFTWLQSTNFISTSSPFYFSVPVINANQRFYRAVMP